MRQVHILMFFIDGFGIGKQDVEANPLCGNYMPYLEKQFGTSPVLLETFENEKLIYIPTDANLGINGLPQSATGQTTLLTGCNASRILGHHFPAYPNKRLIKVINQYSIFKQFTSLGYIPTSANAYSKEYFKLVEDGKLKHTATTLSVLAAEKLSFRMVEDIKKDRAVYMDITNKILIEQYNYDLEYCSPQKAGKILANLTKEYHFVLFEYFLTDVYGHEQDKDKVTSCLKDIDGLIQGILENLDLENNIFLIVSDHGNIEDLTTRSHTRNPVPTIVFNTKKEIRNLWCESIHSLQDITPTIMKSVSH